MKLMFLNHMDHYTSDCTKIVLVHAASLKVTSIHSLREGFVCS